MEKIEKKKKRLPLVIWQKLLSKAKNQLDYQYRKTIPFTN